MSKKKFGAIVAETHWDREWYSPFQGFRKRLVYMIDDLIETMEKDPDYTCFFFDGQTVVLEDYLEIRPENRERLQALLVAGRIAIGPWYCMPDEFLVGDEPLVRNFMRGHRDAREWGVEACKCGYVCDIFGHNSQFPQILNGFGIDNAVLFRGVPQEAPYQIWWESPNGSRVLTAVLDPDRAYSDFYFSIRWPFDDKEYDKDELITRMREHLERKDARQASPVYLLMEGVDHIEIEPKLPWIIGVLNEAFPDVEFEQVLPTEYFARLRESGFEFPVWQGELREPGRRGINGTVLANVLSSRIDLKQANEHCMGLLTDWAEPFGALAALSGKTYPMGFLHKAWDYLLKNHPHDSICGCSHSQVHKDMHFRFDQCRMICDLMIDETLTHIEEQVDTQDCEGDFAVTIFNPSQHAEEEVCVLDLSFPDDTYPENVHLYDEDGNSLAYQIIDRFRDTSTVLTFRQMHKAKKTCVARIAVPLSLPPMGYRTLSYKTVNTDWTIKPGGYTNAKWVEPVRHVGSMAAGMNTFDTGVLLVKANANGTLSVTNNETGQAFNDVLLLEDRADVGDGWNYRKPDNDLILTTTGVAASVAVEEDGLYLARLRIRYTFPVPSCFDNKTRRRSEQTADLGVVHEITLRKGSGRIEVRTTIDNTAKDHIIKVLFPTHLKTNTWRTDTPFDIIERPFELPDRSSYREVDTRVSPTLGYIDVEDAAGGLAIFTKGLYEVEPYDIEARTIALTLMRSFASVTGDPGSLSGQLLGSHTFDYAMRFHGPDEKSIYNECGRFKAGLRTRSSALHDGTMPGLLSIVETANPRVAVTAVKRAEDRDDACVVRLVNLTDESVEDTLWFGAQIAECVRVNLNEEDEAPVEFEGNEIPLEFGAKQILTLRITPKK